MAKLALTIDKDPQGGTSFFNDTILTTVKTLKSKLGEPCDDNNSGSDKVNFEWRAKTDSGEVFYIYDWKEYRRLRETEKITFHIGASDSKISKKAKQELITILNS